MAAFTGTLLFLLVLFSPMKSFQSLEKILHRIIFTVFLRLSLKNSLNLDDVMLFYGQFLQDALCTLSVYTATRRNQVRISNL